MEVKVMGYWVNQIQKTGGQELTWMGTLDMSSQLVMLQEGGWNGTANKLAIVVHIPYLRHAKPMGLLHQLTFGSAIEEWPHNEVEGPTLMIYITTASTRLAYSTMQWRKKNCKFHLSAKKKQPWHPPANDWWPKTCCLGVPAAWVMTDDRVDDWQGRSADDWWLPEWLCRYSTSPLKSQCSGSSGIDTSLPCETIIGGVQRERMGNSRVVHRM